MKILLEHMRRYPLMEPVDAIKLLYQREFGGDHLISDPTTSYNYILEEYRTLDHSEPPRSEPIGNGLVRLYLAGLPEEQLGRVNEAFVRSSERVRGDLERFKLSLGDLRQLAGKGKLSFTMTELAPALLDYAAQGYPMVRHSERYRNAYRPAYRVLLEDELPAIAGPDRRSIN